jgi:phosphodiesterase/alkaline phosphatase D-like protein
VEVLEARLTPTGNVDFTAVAAGNPTGDDVILWTRALDPDNPQSLALTAQVSTDPTFVSVDYAFPGQTDPQRDYTVKVDASGLATGTRYYYRFQKDDGQTSPVGTFQTAPDPAAAVPLHFGFSGDADGRWRPFVVTSDIAAQNFDYFVYLGDTMYETASLGSPAAADPYANPAQALADYRRKYRENLQPVNPGGFAGLRTFFASQANYTLLDNHELGNLQFQSGGAPAGIPYGKGVDASDPQYDVNQTGTYMNKTQGFNTLEQAYSDYQPVREQMISAPDDPRTDQTRQLFLAQQWGQSSIFFNLDDRSYRDIRLKTSTGADDTGPRADNPGRTMLGATQLAWIEQGLLDAQAGNITWKFVAVSSPIDQVGGDGGKSWIGGYRAERNALLKFIADNQIDHVVFLTTDDHQVRVNELTYLTDPNDPSSVALVPGAFCIVAGPLGAGGPDAITDHSFANLKSLADTLAESEIAQGIDPIGLDPAFPGLQNVSREGDPDADSLRQPVDFYSPDTFNYATLDVDASGQVLTVSVYGVDSFAANTFPEPDVVGPPRLLLSFQLNTAGTPEPGLRSLPQSAASRARIGGSRGMAAGPLGGGLAPNYGPSSASFRSLADNLVWATIAREAGPSATAPESLGLWIGSPQSNLSTDSPDQPVGLTGPDALNPATPEATRSSSVGATTEPGADSVLGSLGRLLPDLDAAGPPGLVRSFLTGGRAGQ